MKTIDPTLKHQHEVIQSTFNLVTQNWKKADMVNCALALNELNYQLSEHHEAEFELLFSKIWQNPKIKEGGPFCTYFFNFFMSEKPFARVARHINQIRDANNKILGYELSEQLKPLFENNSMVCIPIEEQLAIRALAKEMNQVAQYWDEKNKNWFSESMNELQDLLQKNIEKEETCLWALARNIA